MKLRTPSPALAISIIALCVALGGSAYAATQITSKEIRNGTIQNVDIKSGTIQSTRLSSGVQKILKKKGAGSAAAAGMVSTEAIRKSGPENQPPGGLVTIASMTIPPGAYVITANTVMTAFTGTTNILEALFGSNGSRGGTCTLDAAGVDAVSYQTIAVNDRQTPATLGMQLTRTVAAPSEVKLMCAGDIPWRTSETSIIATKVDSVTVGEVSG
jgi:hypothetical protein